MSAEGKEKKEEEGDAKERKFRFRRGAEFVVPNHTWTNGYDEHSLEDSHALWPNAPFDELRSHGGDKHPMMETVHPHLQKNLAEADGSRDNLPPPADAPEQFGLGIKREQPKHY